MDNYRVIVFPPEAKRLEKLKQSVPHVAKHILTSLKELGANPNLGALLGGDWKGFFRIRVSNYRIIYQISYSQKIIYVVRIRHRRDVYR